MSVNSLKKQGDSADGKMGMFLQEREWYTRPMELCESRGHACSQEAPSNGFSSTSLPQSPPEKPKALSSPPGSPFKSLRWHLYHPPTYPFSHLLMQPSTHLPIYLLIRISIQSPTHPPTHPSVHHPSTPLIYPSTQYIHPSTHPSIHLGYLLLSYVASLPPSLPPSLLLPSSHPPFLS